MKSIQNTIIKSSYHKKPIVTDVYYENNQKRKPIVIFCHGYKGYKDWGAWNLMVPEFVKNELFFVKFNFSHNGGTVENPIDFPDLEAFGQNNFITELNDLEDAINWILSATEFQEDIDASNIILIGHSRGGGIVSLKAGENNKITKLVTWSGVSDFGARFPTGEPLEIWRKAGISHVENARTKQKMPHYFQFYTSFVENEERLTIETAVSKLKIPQLIVHGEKDVVVPIIEAKNLHEWNPKSELFIVEEMNHPLGCTQPWLGSEMPVHLAQAVQKTIDFILNK